ncbi:MAG TPA: glycosyltransferase 87 family protein [Candidatus Binatia bacterium]|nr:glycosyltransferase 87 family protein [Candidatus Binatia bacterium]
MTGNGVAGSAPIPAPADAAVADPSPAVTAAPARTLLRLVRWLAYGEGEHPRWRMAILAAGFLAASALLAPILYSTNNDLDGFRWPMAEMALAGKPLLVYSVHVGPWRSDNGPLSLVPLTAVVAVINRLGLQDQLALRGEITVVAFGIFTLLMAGEGARAIEAPSAQPARRLVVVLLLLASPPLWIGMMGYGHVELPLEVWLALLSIRLARRERFASAGICFGLAALTRTTLLLAAAPLILPLLRDRRPRAAAVLCATAAATVTAGLLPFLIADSGDVLQSLVGYRSGMPTAGGSLWLLFQGAPWAGFVQHADWLLFGGAGLLLTALALWRRPDRPVPAHRQYALLTVSLVCLPLFAKSVWPYYLVEAYAFSAIWWLASPGGVVSWRLAGPLLLAADAVLLVLEPPFATGPAWVFGLASSLALAVVIGVVLWHLRAPLDEPTNRRRPSGRHRRSLPVTLNARSTGARGGT